MIPEELATVRGPGKSRVSEVVGGVIQTRWNLDLCGERRNSHQLAHGLCNLYMHVEIYNEC